MAMTTWNTAVRDDGSAWAEMWTTRPFSGCEPNASPEMSTSISSATLFTSISSSRATTFSVSVSAIIRSLAVAALALLGYVGVSNEANATYYGAWSTSTNGPTIYQTNYMYFSTYANPLSGTPPTAQVTSFNWSLNLSYYPSGTSAAIADANNYGWWLPSITGSMSVGAGTSANQPFKFAFYIHHEAVEPDRVWRRPQPHRELSVLRSWWSRRPRLHLASLSRGCPACPCPTPRSGSLWPALSSPLRPPWREPASSRRWRP